MKDNIKMLIPIYWVFALVRWVWDVVNPNSWIAQFKALVATLIILIHSFLFIIPLEIYLINK